MENEIKRSAVIYCRAGIKDPLRNAEYLKAQEKWAREYAEELGCEVEKVFIESGSAFNCLENPGVKDLLSYLKDSEKKYYIIAGSAKRFTKDRDSFLNLLDKLKELGAVINFTDVDDALDTIEKLFVHNSRSIFDMVLKTYWRREYKRNSEEEIKAGGSAVIIN
ncbi:MAG: recombinase family protein [bacterium]